MKIVCTVQEFVEIVRGCHDTQRNANCTKCALYRLCAAESDGNVTQFVTAESILPESPKEDLS